MFYLQSIVARCCDLLHFGSPECSQIFMGFATETRARRFLEARRKPLKLVAKEKAITTGNKLPKSWDVDFATQELGSN